MAFPRWRAAVLVGLVAAFALPWLLFTAPAGAQALGQDTLKAECVGGAAVGSGNDGLAADCAVLLGLMDELRGTAALNWSASRPMAQWDGVQLRGRPLRLQNIRLPRRGLDGSLPEALGQLPRLRTLSLGYNQLSGEIPETLGGLGDLRFVDISNNQLSGQIPLSLQNAPLRWLLVSGNSFTGCLPARLRTVGVNDYEFFTIADCPADAVTLRVEAGANGSLTPAAGKHIHARNASVTVNAAPDAGHRILAWGGDCAEVQAATSTCTLTMDGDKSVSLVFKRLPAGPPCARADWPAVADKTNLGLVDDCTVLLGLKGQLRGSVPLNWTHTLPIAQWEGITLSGTPQRVTKLELAALGLDGTLPAALGELDALVRLDLTWNKLGGSIPPELGKLANLTDLLLFRNALTGSIPTELGQLENLQALSLSQNFLSGGIPPELGELSELQSLHLYQNRLTGEIPPELQRLVNIGALFLAENSFTGCIPRGLGSVEHNDFERSGLALCPPPPDAPTLSAFTAASGSARLEWTPGTVPGDRWQYRQHLVMDAGWGEWRPIPGATASTASFTVSGLAQDQRYQFQVRGVNGSGDGVSSEVAGAAAGLTPTPPSTVLFYDVYDPTGGAVEPGAYSFLTDANDFSSGITSFADAQRAVALLINPNGALGRSYFESLHEVSVGDTFTWWWSSKCWAAYRVSVLAGYTDWPERKILLIEPTTQDLCAFEIRDLSDRAAWFIWGTPPSEPIIGRDGIRILPDGYAVEGGHTYRITAQGWWIGWIVIDVPVGMRLVQTGASENFDGSITVFLMDEASGAELGISFSRGREQFRFIPMGHGPSSESRDVSALFDAIVSSARVKLWR